MKYFSRSVLIYVKYNYDKSLSRYFAVNINSISEEEENRHDLI